MASSGDQPDHERDVIAQEIDTSPNVRWGVFVGLQLERHGLSRGEAELVSKEIAGKHRITAWLMLGPGQYTRLR